MSHRDSSDCKPKLNFEYLRTAINWLLKGADFATVRWRSDCTWGTARLLAVAALLWSWADEKLVGDRFSTARRIVLAMFPQKQTVAGTYQAFIKLLRKWTPAFVLILQQTLRQRMQTDLADSMMIGKWVLYGVDGSRVNLARTKAMEQAFSASKRKNKKEKGKGRKKKQYAKAADAKKANSVTMWITTLWHFGTGLPWDWRLGASDSSERAHWLEMMKGIVERALFVADAGFVGYEYSSAAISAGHQVLLRVGSNVTLLKKLGYAKEVDGTVYLWPNKAAKKRQPPLVFRLVVAHNGKHPIYLITSILSTRDLSDAHVLEAYQRRWGIELFYRHLKQTFEMHKLKSTSPESAYVEMNWALLGLWSMALYALRELRQKGIDPNRLSFAKLIRAFQRIIRDYLHPVEQKKKLCDLLREAVIDEYQRSNSKTSRDYPRKKKESPPGAPNIQVATKTQMQLAKALNE